MSSQTGKSDLAEIEAGNGYAGPISVNNRIESEDGAVRVVGDNLEIVATGSIGPFKTIAMFNASVTTPVEYPLIVAWTVPESQTMLENDRLVIPTGTYFGEIKCIASE